MHCLDFGRIGNNPQLTSPRVRSAPADRSKGEPGEERALDLELKTIAHAALIGEPSATGHKADAQEYAANSAAMIRRARRAFCVSGSLRYGTPFEMASMPVSATAPDENARRSSSTPTAAVVSTTTSRVETGADSKTPPLECRANWPA